MEPSMGKPSFMRNLLVRTLLIGVFVLLLRFVYVVTIIGESCTAADFCFFSGHENFNFAGTVPGIRNSATAVSLTGEIGSVNRDLWTSKEWRKTVHFYSSVFQDLIGEGFLSPKSKALCLETPTGQEVFALREVGIADSIGIYKKASPPLVRSGKAFHQPFGDATFDFIFSGDGRLDKLPAPLDFAAEIGRTLKPQGFLVVHTASANDVYSFNSFIDLFNCCTLVRSRHLQGLDPLSPSIREIVLKKEIGIKMFHDKVNGGSKNNCSIPEYKLELVRNAEPLITEEPLKPWITLKRNIQNIKYLPSMADISFKRKYIYVDVGARSYGSSIYSWFKKHYPKQNNTFDIYAIEADKTFHQEYETKKGVSLLPYAAWVRNETLFFEINRDPGQKIEDKGRGMGRIQPVQSSTSSLSDVDRIQGFDFATWLKNTVTEKDFVVMKMDVEGTEFDLIPRLFETGAICLIDEVFLECHYNRWQKCCPGERSSKYQKSYDQCLELFSSLRERGVLVHQWW